MGRLKATLNDPCAKCRTNPRHVTANGKIRSYCGKCATEYANRYYTPKQGKYPRRPKQPKTTACRDCNINPRHIGKDGKTDSYCLKCAHNRAKKYRAKRKLLQKQKAKLDMLNTFHEGIYYRWNTKNQENIKKLNSIMTKHKVRA